MGVVAYDLQYREVGGSTPVSVWIETDTEYNLVGLNPATQWEVRVRAYDDETSSYSNYTDWVQVWTNSAISVNDTAGTDESVGVSAAEFNVNANDAVTVSESRIVTRDVQGNPEVYSSLTITESVKVSLEHYVIEYGPEGGPHAQAVVTVEQYNQTGLTHEQPYEARVKHVLNKEESDWTSWVTVWTDPSAHSGIDVVSVTEYVQMERTGALNIAVNDLVAVTESVSVYDLVLEHDTLVIVPLLVSAHDAITVVDFGEIFFLEGVYQSDVVTITEFVYAQASRPQVSVHDTITATESVNRSISSPYIPLLEISVHESVRALSRVSGYVPGDYVAATLAEKEPSKRYVISVVDTDDNKTHYLTPAIDKLAEVESVDQDLDELIIHDASVTDGQREKRVKPSKLWPMRARTILGRAGSSGGPQVIKPEQMLATTSRAGFMSAEDKAAIGTGGAMGNPNLLVDGNFEYWDEGTSGSGGGYGPTMWPIPAGTWARSTDVPSGSKYSVRLTSTSTITDIIQYIPAYIGRQLAGQDVTISWWAQNVANVSYTRLYIFSFDAEDNPSFMTLRHTGTSFTTIDDTWRKFTQTFTLNSNCANGFRLYVRLGHSSSVALDGRIAQVKLELGTKSTPFYQGPEERFKLYSHPTHMRGELQPNNLIAGSGVKKYIINGNFDIWQRGTSFSGDTYIADRWNLLAGSAEQSSDTPNYNSLYSLGVTRDGNTIIRQRIESCNSKYLVGKNITVSLYAKSTTDSGESIRVELQYTNTKDNFAAIGTQELRTQTMGAINTWGFYTFTFNNLDDIFVNGLQLAIFQSSGAATARITLYSQVQLEVGSVATDFEQRPIGMELALCQRYYQKLSLAGGCGFALATSTTAVRATFMFLNSMRTSPTVSVDSNVNLVGVVGTGISVSFSDVSTVGGRGILDGFAGLTAGNTYIYNSASEYLYFDAEI